MGFFDDVKEDQTLQIQVLCVAFFLIAFPSYFMIKASATENPTGMGGVGSYTVTADFTYIDFASGEEPIQDGTPFTLDLNTDLLDDVDGKNIVGVLVSMSYGRMRRMEMAPAVVLVLLHRNQHLIRFQEWLHI